MRIKYLAQRMEKTFLFAIKSAMMVCLFLAFFGMFSLLIQQLRTLNRTSMVSFFTFFISVYAFIRIYGGFPVGQKHTADIRNSAILGTVMGDLITFIVVYLMGISTTHYFEFSDQFIGPIDQIAPVDPPSFSTFLTHYFTGRVLPGLMVLLAVFVVQICIIIVFSWTANTIYFKINKPKRVLVIYDNPNDLPEVVSKIKKYPNRWKIFGLAHYTDQDLLKKIRQCQSILFFDVPKNERSTLLEYCYKHNRDTYLSPYVSDIIINSSSSFLVDDTTMLATADCGMSFEQLLIKRVGDILFSSVFILLTSPIMLIAAISIRLYDHGPILYKQKRLTKGGREFNVLKFRSMIVNAEKQTGAMLAQQDDERITPVGKFLRRFRLDELPQLLNIFIGDMSVVGPRPERMQIAEEYEKELPEFRYRLKVKAGLTGLAQIMSKYNTTPRDKLILDLAYIQQYSLWLDIKLILQTMIVFLKSDSTEGSHEADQQAIEFVKHQLELNELSSKSHHNTE